MSGDPKSRASDAGFGWTLGRLLALIREHPGTMSASIMLGVIAALCGLAWQIGIFYLIIAALRGDRLWPDSALALGAIALTLVLGRLCFLAATSLSHFIAIGVQRDLRMRIAEHLARVSLGATQRYGIAQLRQHVPQLHEAPVLFPTNRWRPCRLRHTRENFRAGRISAPLCR